MYRQLELATLQGRLQQAKQDLEAMQDGDSDYEWVLSNQREEVKRLQDRLEASENPTKPLLELGNLQGAEGNAFVVLGRAMQVAKQNNMDWVSIEADAKSGDYDHLLAVMHNHFEVSSYES